MAARVIAALSPSSGGSDFKPRAQFLMSHSSSGLRGVTLNDLFVVPAKRATDMRSLGEPVHAKANGDKPQPAWFYFINWLLDALTYSTVPVVAFTVSDALLRHFDGISSLLSPIVVSFGQDPAKLLMTGVISLALFGIMSLSVRQLLQDLLALNGPDLPPIEAGYLARAKLPLGAVSFGPLKITYSVTSDALVVRSLKDHAVSVVSMEMVSWTMVGEAEVLYAEPEQIDQSNHDDAENEARIRNHDRSEFAKLNIEKDDLKTWIGPKGSLPVIVSLRTGDVRTPLIIHGLYFDGQASEDSAFRTFDREFKCALVKFHPELKSLARALKCAQPDH